MAIMIRDVFVLAPLNPNKAQGTDLLRQFNCPAMKEGSLNMGLCLFHACSLCWVANIQVGFAKLEDLGYKSDFSKDSWKLTTITILFLLLPTILLFQLHKHI